MVSRAALILAGGRARRFQTIDKVWQDKALAQLQGKPLLIHAIESVVNVVDEVVVCVNDSQRSNKYAQELQAHGLANIRLVVDEQVSGISGPNVAIMSGLKAVNADYCFTMPCDMPLIKPEIADYLFTECRDSDIAVPMWPNGKLETLMMVLRHKIALEVTQTLCSLKRPRSDDIARGLGRLKLVSPIGHIKVLDPELKSFININYRDDLSKLLTRQAHGIVVENLNVDLGVLSIADLNVLREAVKMAQQSKLNQALTAFASCVDNFEATELFFWAGLSGENQGEALLKLDKQEIDSKQSTCMDFDAKEAYHKAANNYCLEAQVYEKNHCRLLEERALADKMWCESWAMGKTGHIQRYASKVANLR